MICYIGIISSLGVGLYLAVTKHFRIYIPTPSGKNEFLGDYYNYFYYKPYTRCCVYILGILYGYMYKTYKMKIEESIDY